MLAQEEPGKTQGLPLTGGCPTGKANVWVSSDGRRVVVLLLNGRTADPDAGDRRAAQALNQLYCTA
jgi:hypothetical protein